MSSDLVYTRDYASVAIVTAHLTQERAVTHRSETRLRSWREEHDLTLQEVSDLTGVSPSMLSRVESGQRNMSPLAKVRVARCLGVRVADLFEPEEQVMEAAAS